MGSRRQRATGVARWSGLRRHSHTTDWHRISVDPGGLLLVPGRQYVLFLSVTGISQPDSPNGDSGHFAKPQSRDLYPGGSFVFTNNGESAWATEAWDGGAGDYLARAATSHSGWRSAASNGRCASSIGNLDPRCQVKERARPRARQVGSALRPVIGAARGNLGPHCRFHGP